jgi:hypothetical protein
MLIKQNAELRRDLGAIEQFRHERDQALAEPRTAEADLAALRNLNQRLMVETHPGRRTGRHTAHRPWPGHQDVMGSDRIHTDQGLYAEKVEDLLGVFGVVQQSIVGRSDEI